ncbi:MAG: ATP cone domain-containing protein [Spirochaetaceae bacterium]
MIDKIVKRDGRVVPFNKEKITFAVLQAAVAVGGRDRGIAEGIADKVVELLQSRRAPDDPHRPEVHSYPTVEEVQDTVEKVLIEEGHARTAKAYIVYRYEHALKRRGRESLTYSRDNIPYKKLWETLSWAVGTECYSLERIRNYVEGGRFADLVEHSEAFYRSEIAHARHALSSRLDDVRVVIVSGPSSSGKTTTTIKLAEQLSAEGKRFVPINVDNYFFDLETHPQDPSGDYDFETPQALDMDLLNEHLSDLLSGKSVDIPFYDFKTGTRTGVAETVSLGPDDIILIDSLHGFFEPMTESVPAEQKFKLYIETLAQVKDDHGRFIRWADVRMLRRMVRDMQFRNYGPRQTLRHWYLVRRSELRYIIARLQSADAIVNSFMPSELPLMKRRLGTVLPGLVEELEGDPEKSDALDRGTRVLELFSMLPDVDGEDLLPGDSLLREFLGGSVYAY